MMAIDRLSFYHKPILNPFVVTKIAPVGKISIQGKNSGNLQKNKSRKKDGLFFRLLQDKTEEMAGKETTYFYKKH